MAPIRLRHPKGVTTVEIDLTSDEVSVRDLQQIIFKHTEIMPAAQELKTGYPPHLLTVIPELPISSLGLQRGEQLVVSEVRSASSQQLNTSTPSSNSRSVSAPAPIPPPPQVLAQSEQSRTSVDTVRVDGGVLIHRIVPDDNSCLFSSISLVFTQDISSASQMRQLVADEIKKDDVTYDEAVLGQSRESYIAAISKPTTWGGAIELSIFARHFATEIASIDVETGRTDRFGEGTYTSRAILLYSGIHYDAVSLAPTENAPQDFHQTLFDLSNQAVLNGALELASKLRKNKKFTNTATFTLKCEICGKGLTGEKEARQHAKDTGHAQFGEY